MHSGKGNWGSEKLGPVPKPKAVLLLRTLDSLDIHQNHNSNTIPPREWLDTKALDKLNPQPLNPLTVNLAPPGCAARAGPKVTPHRPCHLAPPRPPPSQQKKKRKKDTTKQKNTKNTTNKNSTQTKPRQLQQHHQQLLNHEPSCQEVVRFRDGSLPGGQSGGHHSDGTALCRERHPCLVAGRRGSI